MTSSGDVSHLKDSSLEPSPGQKPASPRELPLHGPRSPDEASSEKLHDNFDNNNLLIKEWFPNRKSQVFAFFLCLIQHGVLISAVILAHKPLLFSINSNRRIVKQAGLYNSAITFIGTILHAFNLYVWRCLCLGVLLKLMRRRVTHRLYNRFLYWT